MSAAQHLAQLNIGRLRYPTDDPRMADFMNNLDLVNGLAERSEPNRSVRANDPIRKSAERPHLGRASWGRS